MDGFTLNQIQFESDINLAFYHSWNKKYSGIWLAVDLAHCSDVTGGPFQLPIKCLNHFGFSWHRKPDRFRMIQSETDSKWIWFKLNLIQSESIHRNSAPMIQQYCLFANIFKTHTKKFLPLFFWTIFLAIFFLTLCEIK